MGRSSNSGNTASTSRGGSRKRSAPSSASANSSNGNSKMWNSQKKKKSSASSSSTSMSGINETAAAAMFDEMRQADGENEDPNFVTMEGVVHLGEKLGVDAVEDIRILVLLWKLGCNKKPGGITRDEWMQGCSALQFDSWEALKSKQLPGLDIGFLTNTEFKDFYKFCFQFNRQGTYRTLDKDLVVALLKLTLQDRIPNDRLESFCTFLEENPNPQYARITLDQWTSFWDFCMECPELSSYDDSTSAWPVLLDEYVDYMVERKSGSKSNKS